MGIDRSLSQKRIINVDENIPFNRSKIIKFCLYNIHLERNKIDTN